MQRSSNWYLTEVYGWFFLIAPIIYDLYSDYGLVDSCFRKNYSLGFFYLHLHHRRLLVPVRLSAAENRVFHVLVSAAASSTANDCTTISKDFCAATYSSTEKMTVACIHNHLPFHLYHPFLL